MNRLASLAKLFLSLLLVLSSPGALSSETDVSLDALSATMVADESRHETILLVSLEDGTVIKQIINVDADICFKQNASSATTCLTQGDPIIDAATNTVIGFKMIEDQIELIAKTD